MLKLLFILLLFLKISCGETSFSGSSAVGSEGPMPSDADASVKVEAPKGQFENQLIEKETKAEPAPEAKLEAEPKPEIKTEEQIKNEIIDQCATVASREVIKQSVLFPAAKECLFGQNGNLPARDQFFQGRVEQEQTINVPANYVVCDMNINSKTQDLHYDDFFVLAIEDQILVSTNDRFTPNLVNGANQVFKWSFETYKGAPWGENTKYCFGSASVCDIPSHDREGPLSINIPKQDFVNLAVELFSLKQIGIKMVTLGDNDNGDCEHSRLELDLEMTIAPSK